MLPDTPVLGEGLAPPANLDSTPRLSFIKLPPGTHQTIVVLSHTWTGGITHYAGGRMKLHADENCPYCEAGQKPRWYAWLHIMTQKTRRQFIAQLPSSSHGVLLKHFETHGTLRSFTAELARRGKAPNTPTTITMDAFKEPSNDLPEPAKLPELLQAYMQWTSGTGSEQTSSPPTEGGDK